MTWNPFKRARKDVINAMTGMGISQRVATGLSDPLSSASLMVNDIARGVRSVGLDNGFVGTINDEVMRNSDKDIKHPERAAGRAAAIVAAGYGAGQLAGGTAGGSTGSLGSIGATGTEAALGTTGLEAGTTLGSVGAGSGAVGGGLGVSPAVQAATGFGTAAGGAAAGGGAASGAAGAAGAGAAGAGAGGLTAGQLLAGSSALSALASNEASRRQVNAGNRAIDAQLGMFDTTQRNISPYLNTGAQYAGTLADLGNTGYATHQFGPEDLKAGLAPNYEWIKQQGLMAANNASSVQGGLAGTNAQRAAIDYAENLAGNAYQNAFLNFNNQRNNIFSNLNSIASLGSNAAVGQGNIAANVGGNIGNTMTGIGNAQAGGIVGGANAISGGLGNYLGYNYLSNVGQGGQNASVPGYGAGSAQNVWKPAPDGSPSFVGP